MARTRWPLIVLWLSVAPAAGVQAQEVATALLEPTRAPGWSQEAVESALDEPTSRETERSKSDSPAELRTAVGRRTSGDPTSPEWPTVPATPVPAPDEESLEVESGSILDDEALAYLKPNVVMEPTVAGGDILLATGNWFAAYSRDDGGSFEPVDPRSVLGRGPGDSDYCCDQVTAYDADRDLLLWLVQYEQQPKENILRLAVSGGSDQREGTFWTYDLRPQAFGREAGAWFDFSDLVVGKKHLIVTTFVSDGDSGRFVEGAAIRLPLDDLQAYRPLEAAMFTTEEGALRATRGAGSEMALATNSTDRTLLLWRWSDGSASPTGPSTIEVERSDEMPCPHRWLSGADSTLMAGWADGKHYGFAWMAGPGDGPYPRPHVRVVILERRTLAVVAQPHLWSESLDFAYPAIAPNARGIPGISVHYAGDDARPGHAVGVLMPPCEPGAEWTWRLERVEESEEAPIAGKWGDYLAVTPDGADPESWLSAGYVLDADGAFRPHWVRFGLEP